MQTTIDSSRGMRPCSISFFVTAIVVPPAGSVKMPSVSASRWMPSRISSSVTISAQPPVSFSTSITWKPSAGLPMAIDLAMVSGRTGSG